MPNARMVTLDRCTGHLVALWRHGSVIVNRRLPYASPQNRRYTPPPLTSFPVVIYGRGTVGIRSDCALTDHLSFRVEDILVQIELTCEFRQRVRGESTFGDFLYHNVMYAFRSYCKCSISLRISYHCTLA